MTLKPPYNWACVSHNSLLILSSSFISFLGITSEGIFRINGNSRVVERLRTSFDRTGDADLAEAGDVMAVAGLLKLYLRELPEGVIPDHMTQLFVTTQLGKGVSQVYGNPSKHQNSPN